MFVSILVFTKKLSRSIDKNSVMFMRKSSTIISPLKYELLVSVSVIPVLSDQKKAELLSGHSYFLHFYDWLHS